MSTPVSGADTCGSVSLTGLPTVHHVWRFRESASPPQDDPAVGGDLRPGCSGRDLDPRDQALPAPERAPKCPYLLASELEGHALALAAGREDAASAQATQAAGLPDLRRRREAARHVAPGPDDDAAPAKRALLALAAQRERERGLPESR